MSSIKTFTGDNIHSSTLGILYICKFTRNPFHIEVIKTLQFSDPSIAIEAFANIPNPESQVACGVTQETFLKELEELHNNMKNSVWLKALGDCV